MTTHTQKLIADGMWQPIEYAPRDGTSYLARNESDDWAVCAWNSMEWSKSEPCVFPLADSTHFRPLPDNRLALCLARAVEAMWKVVDNVPLNLVTAKILLDEALAEIERIAEKGE